MKRRVLIAKALSHEPKILFLDEPTAGVDVDLRRDMWRLIKNLKEWRDGRANDPLHRGSGRDSGPDSGDRQRKDLVG